MRYQMLVLLAITCLSCKAEFPRYQFERDQAGNLTRLDTKTGAVVAVKAASASQSSTESSTPLISSEVVAALAGGLLAGLFSVGLAHLTHKREARERQAAWQRESTEQRNEWIRDRLFDSYSEAVYYLVKLSASAATRSRSDEDEGKVRQHLSQCQRYLNLIRCYHSGPAIAQAIDGHTAALALAWDNNTDLSNPAEAALKMVKQLLADDKRVQV